MKKFLIALALLAGGSLAASAETTKEDLKKLAKAGVGDEVILAFVRANGPVAKLTSDDLVELKDAGLSDKVLKALLEPAAEQPARRPEEKPAETAPPAAPEPPGRMKTKTEAQKLNGLDVVRRERVVVREEPAYVIERPVVVTTPVYSYSWPVYSTYGWYRTGYSYNRCATATVPSYAYRGWSTCSPTYVYRPSLSVGYSWNRCRSGLGVGGRW